MTTITNNKLTDERVSNATLIRLIQWAEQHNSHYVAAALCELQERRKADSAEPIGWTDAEELRSVEKDGCGYLFKANPISPNADPRRVIKLYRHAPPAPVVPDEWTIQDAVKFCRETGRQDAGSAMEAWNACRAAMLNAEPLHATPKGNRLRIAEGKLAEYSLSKREPQPTPESADRKMLKRLAVIMSGSDSGGEISALTVTAQSLVDRCKALALSTSQEPQPLTLANETMDVERLREIAEEDNGSDVKFECSVMARMLLSVALNSDPVAYTDAEELESLEGVDGHSYAHLWPNSYGFGKDIALYTVPQMMPLPVNILDDETNRDVFEAWVADYTGYTKGFVRQFRVDDKYRSDSMWNKYWNTWNACRTAMLNGGKS